AAFRHRFTIPVYIGAGDGRSSADPDVIGAVYSAAAEIEGDKQVVKAIVTNEERSFDGSLDLSCPGPAGERIEGSLRVNRFAGRSIELDQLDPAPETAECQPGPLFLIEKEIGINGVPIVALFRLNDQTFVLPPVLGSFWIQGDIGRQADGRM